jgi:hypothetical protein
MPSSYKLLKITPSLELGDLNWQADSHEEACERLREVLQVGRPQPPAIPVLSGVGGEITNRETVDLSEIDDQGPSIVLRIFG